MSIFGKTIEEVDEKFRTMQENSRESSSTIDSHSTNGTITIMKTVRDPTVQTIR